MNRRESSAADSYGISRRAFVGSIAAAAAAAAAARRADAVAAENDDMPRHPLPARPSVHAVSLTVNGRPHQLRIEPRVTLLDALRDRLGFTGTKKGCDRGQCGACTVIVDGRRVNACLTLAIMCEGAAITTVEGLARATSLSDLQRAFVARDAFQCGYCTPGQLCSATALMAEFRAGQPSAATRQRKDAAPALDDAEIRERMSGNLCRCGAYPNIVAAIREAAEGS